MDSTSRKQSPEPEVVFRDGRDEMNLIEFPLASMSERLPADTRVLIVESEAADGTCRRLTIAGSTAYGLPTAKDDEVLVALIQLAKLQGFAHEKISFSRYQILQVLGWPLSGQSYERVDLAINRWVGVTYFWENSWWDKEAESWVDEKFGILDNAELYDRERYRKRAGKSRQVPLPLSWAKWNEVIFRSFRSGYIKHLDMDVYRSLKRPLSKRLYRYLDKHFYRRGTLRFDIQRLAREKLGLFGKYDNANLRRILEPAIKELETHWDLKPESSKKRFVSPHRGLCEVIFERTKGKRRVETDDELREAVSGLEQELLNRGVMNARELVEGYPEERIQSQIENFDDRHRNGVEVSAGWLRRAIEEGFGFRKGFKPTAVRDREAAEKAERAKRNERERIRKARERKEEQALEQEAWNRFLTIRNSIPEERRLALEDEALRELPKLQCDMVLKARREGEVGMFHQLLWEQYIIPTINVSK